ncbi:O-linked N-acetylglucosamine transferase family protein [Selenomonas noxia]|uniref:O-linked N-acetylglucosamine transferase, SPINDLY family protein n=1 Tax=Selenomonas noxia TaxID=135083 RepID=UPI0028803F55|nr:hypothetical protein [Selenomonas noxia]
MKKKRAHAGHRKKHAAQNHMCRKIRLGYLSADFGMGRARDLLPAFFSGYDQLRYEVYAYHTGIGGDVEPFSKEVEFREIGRNSAEEAAALIRRDAVDLLVDLSLGTPTELIRRVMELRPAPHIISLAEMCPAELAEQLPAVEGKEVFPYCYAPFELVSRYAYRTPLLDAGMPTIGIGGTLHAGEAEWLLQLLAEMLRQMRGVRLILPAAVAGAFSSEDFDRLAEAGTEESSLDLVDELSYDAIDLALGAGVDLIDVCRAADHGVPLLTAMPLVRGRRAADLLNRLKVPPAQTIGEAAVQACALCSDLQRLSELHELLHWRLHDAFDPGAILFSVERAYERALMKDAAEPAEELAAVIADASAREDWDTVLHAAHALDGMEQLRPEQRLDLAWAYFFRDMPTLAGRWALAAEGVPRGREGARLYLSVVSAAPPGTSMEIFARAQEGLALIEDGLPAVSDVRTILLKMGADHGVFVCGSAAASAYAMAYAQETADVFMRRCYYGAGLFKLNAADVSAQEVYQKSLGYADLFPGIQQFSHRNHRVKEKIRIGYISGDFRQHVMQYFVWPFLAGFDRTQFEVYVYSLGKSDQYSKFFQTLVTKWRDFSDHTRDMERIAREIHADEVDILFDLGGHTSDSGLAALAWKPAPVQISGLGYMATTGLPAVDYFVTDHFCDPEDSGSERVYVEKLLRLTSQFCYNGYTHLPASAGTPARTKGYVQFASFNQYLKLHDAMLHAWCGIMERVPTARLLLKNSDYGRPGIAVLAHDRLKRLGFDMSRVQFEGASRDYMLRYLDVDIALDTFPWPGGGTTCDALYMGVPVVSYYTDRHSTRFTYSLLANMGLAELASDRLEDYIETAAALAGNLDLLDALHRELRPRMKASPVMDQERYIREMEECYRAIWAQWNAEQADV